MHSIFKLMIVNKVNAITNLNYLLKSISNVKERMKNPEFHSNKPIKIRDQISDPITQFVTREDIKPIDQVAAGFASRFLLQNRELSLRCIAYNMHRLTNLIIVLMASTEPAFCNLHFYSL